jgi:hypothetical protein
MALPEGLDSIAAYLRTWASELGERIVQTYPPLHGFPDDSPMAQPDFVDSYMAHRTRGSSEAVDEENAHARQS